MLSSIMITLVFHVTTASACWAECPKGEECYFEEVWLTQTELQKMADGQCPANDNTVLQASTGMTVEFHCSPEGNIAKQTAPDLSMKVRGEETSTAPRTFRSECSGQEDCLAADRENKKLFDEIKAQQTAANTLPPSP